MSTTRGKGFVMSWTPEAFMRGIRARNVRAVEAMAIAYETEVKRVLSKPGPMKTKPTEGQRERMEGAGEERRASLPGEPPRKRTGALRASITHVPMAGGTIQRVGSALKYARDLERGLSPWLKPRPFLRPTLYRMMGALNSIYIRVMRYGG